MKHNLSVDFRSAAIFACGLLLAAACTRNNPPTQQSGQNQVLTAPTGATIAVEPEDGQWTMPAKNYASTRFSGLQDINTGNAAALKLAWSFSTGVVRGHEAAPIIANNTMYIITPFPNYLYALDLTKVGVDLCLVLHAADVVLGERRAGFVLAAEKAAGQRVVRRHRQSVLGDDRRVLALVAVALDELERVGAPVARQCLDHVQVRQEEDRLPA